MSDAVCAQFLKLQHISLRQAYLPIYNVSRVSGSSGWEAEINMPAQPVRLSKQMIERAGEQQAERVCDVMLSPRRNLSHFSGFSFFLFFF